MSVFLNAKDKFYNPHKVAKFFKLLGLPCPDNFDECSPTSDFGILVPLNHVGLIVRIANNDLCPRYRHPYILQPLLSKGLDEKFRADIYPGIRTPGTVADRRFLDARLFEDGIHFTDPQEENMGYLPYHDTGYDEKGFPVVLDAGAVGKLDTFIEDSIAFAMDGYEDQIWETSQLRRIFTIRAENRVNAQSVMYGTVTQAFSEAWPENKRRADQGKLMEIWRHCAQMRVNGELLDTWNDFDYDDDRGLSICAANYEARWRKAQPDIFKP